MNSPAASSATRERDEPPVADEAQDDRRLERLDLGQRSAAGSE